MHVFLHDSTYSCNALASSLMSCEQIKQSHHTVKRENPSVILTNSNHPSNNP